jgi:hypothetical protein
MFALFGLYCFAAIIWITCGLVYSNMHPEKGGDTFITSIIISPLIPIVFVVAKVLNVCDCFLNKGE